MSVFINLQTQGSKHRHHLVENLTHVHNDKFMLQSEMYYTVGLRKRAVVAYGRDMYLVIGSNDL